jgi:dihydropteroate synthase
MTKITEFKHSQFIHVRGNLYDLGQPRIMGILNLTPDSFWEGSRVCEEKAILNKANDMVQEGADILDIGAVSTRPGAVILTFEEEIERLGQTIHLLRSNFPNILISVDTYHSMVAEWAVQQGADIINDVSGGQYDLKMFDVVAKNKVPYILTHSEGKGPAQKKDKSRPNIIGNMLRFFSQRIEMLTQKGVKDIIIDPGFGFDKTMKENFEIAKQLELFHILNRPLLVGVSRKSMIHKTLDVNAEASLNGTTALHGALFLKKCNVFRVHDVKEMVEVRELLMRMSE